MNKNIFDILYCEDFNDNDSDNINNNLNIIKSNDNKNKLNNILDNNYNLNINEFDNIEKNLNIDNYIFNTEYKNDFNDVINYIEPKIINNINLEKYFSKDDIELSIKNNKLIQITDKGLYSISKYHDAEWITQIILDFLKYKKISSKYVNIIDSTAGIGGNTINFSKYFSKVYSIEINNVHYEVLNNNINALSIKNVETYFDNFLNLISILNNKSYIFFLDPPWGGSCYKNYKYFNLKIGKLELYSIINELYEKKFKYVILKAPYNLNISSLNSLIKYQNMNIYNNYKKSMLLIIFY
jgi:hypothetical protein